MLAQNTYSLSRKQPVAHSAKRMTVEVLVAIALVLRVSPTAAANDKRTADCAQTLDCKLRGLCSGDAGVCRASTHADCAQSVGCSEFGLCRPRYGKCIALRASECRASRACLTQGRCLHKHYACVKPDACFPDSEACRIEGRCTQRSGVCIAASDADCAIASPRDCVSPNSIGYCRAYKGYCAQVWFSDETCTMPCSWYGMCHSEGNLCLATSESCRQYPGCRDQGKCTLSFGRCVRGRESDCLASGDCKTHGDCHFWRGRCVAESLSDCLASKLCLNHPERCSYWADKMQCHVRGAVNAVGVPKRVTKTGQ